MKVWLVNPFDPLPGEQEQLGRYAYLARCLRSAGHEVVWWSSDFSHRFKRFVDAEAVRDAAREWGIQVELVPTPAYSHNVSLRRVRSHRAYGETFATRAAQADPPDLILASSPPLESAAAAAEYGRQRNVPALIDIQDQWPDNFARLFPAWLRWSSRLVLGPLYKVEKRAYSVASGIVGVAQGYVDRGVAVGGGKQHTGSFPLGVDLADVDNMMNAADRWASKWPKPDDQLWLLYSGSLSHNYDFLTIVHAAIPARERFGSRVRFLITGTGELAPHAARIIAQHQLDNVTLTGFLEFTEWAWLLRQADVGFNASFPDALIYLPNKIFYYLASGAAVMNTIPGECAQIVSDSGCGLNYTAGDVDSCFAAICKTVEDDTARQQMQTAARKLAEERFDRRIVYTDFTRFLESVANT